MRITQAEFSEAKARSSILSILALWLVLFTCGQVQSFERQVDPDRAQSPPMPRLIKDENPEARQSDLTGSIRSIDSTVVFAVREGFADHTAPCEPCVLILQRTDRIYPLGNLSLISTKELSANRIVIRYEGILKPNAMLDCFGPAQTNTYFDLPGHEYELVFQYRSMIDNYKLIIDDSLIIINPIKTSFTRVEDTLYWRYKPSSFTFHCGDTTATSTICNKFVDTLMNQIDLVEFTYPDYGAIPYKRATGGYPIRFFLYGDESDYKKAGEILKAYTMAHINSEINMSMRNWKNQRYMSWMFLRGD